MERVRKKFQVKMKKLIAVIVILLQCSIAYSQEADYYRMEIGGGVGVWNYLGDFNGNLLKGFQPQVSAMWKYLPNERMAIKADFSFGNIKGNASDAKGYLPAELADYKFKTTLYDLSAMFEYNFWRHGMSGDYRHLQRLVPYITLGIGGTFIHYEGVNKGAFCIPLGIGAKYKIAERVNFGAEWMMHFSTSDYLDGVKDYLGIKSSGIFKNTDGFGQLKLYLTYSFMAKCRQCNNQ